MNKDTMQAFSCVPVEMQQKKQWVLWKLEERQNEKGEIKKTKLPYQTNGYGAQSNNPATWNTFQNVLSAYNNGGFSGIGFMFYNDYIGIDFDHVVKDGVIEAEFQAWIEKFSSYTEISQSGTGLHILVKGKIPGEKRRKGNVEMYFEKRYFAITAHVVGDYREIKEAQNIIDDLYHTYLEPATKTEPKEIFPQGNIKNIDNMGLSLDDSKVIEIASNAKNKDSFLFLWKGGISRHGNDHSAADQALCNMLAYYTQDAGQIDRLFRNSGLYREKWDSKRGEKTYGEITINTAISGLSSTYKKIKQCHVCGVDIRLKQIQKANGEFVYVPCNVDGSQHSHCKKCKERIIWKEKKPYNINGKRHKCNMQHTKNHANTSIDRTTKDKNTPPQISPSVENTNIITPCFVYTSEKGGTYIITGIAADYFYSITKDLLFFKESFWQYQEKLGIWECLHDDIIKGAIRKMITDYDNSLAKKSTIEDIFYQVRLNACAPKDFEFDKNHTKINLINGVLDINSMALDSFSKELFQTIKLPVSYIPKASSQKWEQYLKDLCLFPETISRLQEWAGYCFFPSVKIQKCLYLKGEGDNGKSIFLNTISNILGKACSRLEITEIYERFRVTELQGKLANICADIKTECLSDKFKEIIDGNEVLAEEKFKKPYHYKPYCKFMFSANNFLPTKDKSHGFFKRFDTVEFKRKFSKEEINPNLQDEINLELSGVFSWALEGLKRLKENNWKLTESREFDATKEEFQKESNPVKAFIDECCFVVPNDFTEIDKFMRDYNLVSAEDYQNFILEKSSTTQEAYKKYREFCLNYGYSPLTEVHFGKEIQRLEIEKYRTRTRAKNNKVHIYKRLIIQ